MSEPPQVERRKLWSFTITDAGWGWTLTHPDGREEHSARTFTSLEEAGADAEGHGYGVWKGPERRAPDSQL
ncbi:MAG: hypothetical protein ACXW2A_04450 [Burkholderiales bacterium]